MFFVKIKNPTSYFLSVLRWAIASITTVIAY